MRDSALKRGGPHADGYSTSSVGEELMRDSALKRIGVYRRLDGGNGSEKSSCATAL